MSTSLTIKRHPPALSCCAPPLCHPYFYSAGAGNSAGARHQQLANSLCSETENPRAGSGNHRNCLVSWGMASPSKLSKKDIEVVHRPGVLQLLRKALTEQTEDWDKVSHLCILSFPMLERFSFCFSTSCHACQILVTNVISEINDGSKSCQLCSGRDEALHSSCRMTCSMSFTGNGRLWLSSAASFGGLFP